MMFELTSRLAGSQLVVVFRGQLDTAETARAVAAITALRTAGQRVIFDLSALDFIDCAALRALLEVRQQALRAGGDVLLAAPHEGVRRLLALTGLDDWFSVHATVAAAIASGHGRPAEQREPGQAALPA